MLFDHLSAVSWLLVGVVILNSLNLLSFVPALWSCSVIYRCILSIGTDKVSSIISAINSLALHPSLWEELTLLIGSVLMREWVLVSKLDRSSWLHVRWGILFTFQATAVLEIITWNCSDTSVAKLSVLQLLHPSRAAFGTYGCWIALVIEERRVYVSVWSFFKTWFKRVTPVAIENWIQTALRPGWDKII